jgi:hypothetical protein
VRINETLTTELDGVCNPRMSDAELIEKLGGPAKICELLAIDKSRGVQRVHNWKRRGIPSDVKLSRPDLFLPGWTPNVVAQPEASNAP